MEGAKGVERQKAEEGDIDAFGAEFSNVILSPGKREIVTTEASDIPSHLVSFLEKCVITLI